MTELDKRTKQLFDVLSDVIKISVEDDPHGDLYKVVYVTRAVAALAAVSILVRHDIEKSKTPKLQLSDFVDDVEETMAEMMLVEE